MRLRKKLRGIALVRTGLAVVCGLVLALVGMMGISSYIQTARANQAKADTAALAAAVERYAYDMGNAYPSYNPAQCLPSNLTTLADKNTATGCGPWITGNSLKKSGTSYLDPWGNAYVYSHGSTTDGRFVVYSKGPEGKGSVGLDGTVTSKGIGACGGAKM